MGLKMKWHLRQIVLGYVACFFSLTSTLLILIGIKFWKYVQYGGQLKWPKGTQLDWMLEWFYLHHAKALIVWIPVTLLLDLLIRRFIYELNE